MRRHFTVTLAQARALAALAPEATDGFLFGAEPLTDELLAGLRLSGWSDDAGELHVLLMPAHELVTLTARGEERARRSVSRIEALTLSLHVDPMWAAMRTLLAARGTDPAEVVIGELFDDDDEVEIGLLVTAGRRIVLFARRHDPDLPGDPGAFERWDDVTDEIAGRPEWRDAAEAAVALHDELRSAGC